MSETMGRCFNEVYERRGSPSELKIADALDRLAADVEAIKAKVDAVSPEDVKHFVDSEKAWVALVTEQRDAAIRERDDARAEVERLKAERAARQAVNSSEIPNSSPAAPQPAAPAAGWLREDERDVLEDLAFRIERWVKVDKYDADRKRLAALRSILARAGLPPVVEVPLFENYAPEVLHLRYRDAISRAGVSWKEVPRE